ncbi:CBS domain multi-pass transmembrane protein [Cryptosporidium ryanae]|uniref:CBS domain multi-pass transmembrane protein n=1 Tax=Cryptosporidium ryanae TaxID=515981 RepID=UPI00351A5818|nr:CBS domain multi-pass transmembrane protein [Cryptosporidium ryanae]
MLWKQKINAILVRTGFLLTIINKLVSLPGKDLHLCEASHINGTRIENIGELANIRYRQGTIEYYLCILISLILVIIGGIASGLTTGLMSLDGVQLKVLIQTGSEKERKWALTALNLIKRHHLLLVTLLLTNSICMETLPLFLDKIIPSWLAVLLSVTAILIFGEILPQAICTGKHQLMIAGNCSSFVNILTFCLFFFSWPISKLLDYFIGNTNKVNNFYARAQLKALIALHRRTDDLRNRPVSIVLPATNTSGNKMKSCHLVQKSTRVKGERNINTINITQNNLNSQYLNSDTVQSFINTDRETSLNRLQLKGLNDFKSLNTENGLANDEVTIIQGVLDMANKSLLELSVPLENVYMLHIDSKLDHSLLEDILTVGHSRIPIFSKNRHNIEGLLLVKSLITIDPDDSVTIKSLFDSKHCNRYIVEPIFAYPQTNPYDALNIFQQGHCHIAILTNYVKEYTESRKNNTPLPERCEIIGIATLEDIIEEIIQEEIIDEFDTNTENRNYPSICTTDRNLIRTSSLFKFSNKSISNYFNLGFKKSTKNRKYYEDNFSSAPELWNPIYSLNESL